MKQRPISFDAIHKYSIELNVQPTKCYLLENNELSTKFVPVFDLGYIANSPYGQVRKIPDIGSTMNDPARVHSNNVIVLNEVSDPNSLGSVPKGTFDNMPQNTWWLSTGSFRTVKPGGFGGGPMGAVGSSSWGSMGAATITLLDMTQPIPDAKKVPKLTEVPGWGFSQVEWVDMDGDGKSDCVSIRTRNDQAELVWLRQPQDNGKWDINILIEDINGQNFKVVKILDHKNVERVVIIVAAFIRSELIVIWVDDDDNDWTRIQMIRTATVDTGMNFYSVDVVDLNGDGRMDILTSVAGVRGKTGAILGYEIPEDISNPKAKWRKHILFDQFAPMASFNRMTPGISIPFQPTYTSKKPSILVSGSDDGQLYVLRPTSWSVHIWKYESKVILKRPNPIGVPAVKDVDGDGVPEIFAPEGKYLHFLNYVAVYEEPKMSAASSSQLNFSKRNLRVFNYVCVVVYSIYFYLSL